MSHRPSLADLAEKSAAFWASYKPLAPFKPRNVWESIKHEQLERLNERTMSKFAHREESPEGERFEGDYSVAQMFADSDVLREGETKTLADYKREIWARRSDETIAADETADLEAAAMEEAYLEKRRYEAELETLHFFRESTYVRHVRNRTGEVLPPEAYAKLREQRAQLEEDTIELALRLQSADRPALGTGPQTYLVGIVTGETKSCINVKKRAILPTVAAEKRAPIIKALEFLLLTPAHKWDQFCTFTHGVRVPIDPVSAGWELRQAFIELHRKISRLNAEPFMRLFGAQILFRASEIGSLKDKETGELKRDEQGRVTAHPHAHCLIHFTRFLKREDMAEWTRCVWAFWDAHWSIDGAIEQVRETCKYVGKPSDLKSLSIAELAALDIALFKLHRVQPLGELREAISARRESCLTVKKERRAEGDSVVLKPVVLPDWNARKRDRKETAEKKRRKKLRAELARAKKRARRDELRRLNEERRADWLKAHAKHIEKHAQGDLFGPPMPPPPPEPVPLTELPLVPAHGPARRPVAFRNRIVARLAPSFYFGPVSQPAIMVWSDRPLTREDIDAMLSQHFVAPAADVARPIFEQAMREKTARASGVSVHTSPVTVRPEKPRPAFLPALLKASNWEKSAALATN